jgi:hypothetical protein
MAAQITHTIERTVAVLATGGSARISPARGL